MNHFKDFKNINSYSIYIKNKKWSFNFSANRISASPGIDFYVYDTSNISKDISDYNSYLDCFKDIVKQIDNLSFCNLCKRFDDSFCKICKLNDIVDEITENDLNLECPVCYKLMSNRHVSICNNTKHIICSTCFENIDSRSCPICRQTNEDEF